MEQPPALWGKGTGPHLGAAFASDCGSKCFACLGIKRCQSNALVDTQGFAEVVRKIKSTVRTGSDCSEMVRAGEGCCRTDPQAGRGGKKDVPTPLLSHQLPLLTASLVPPTPSLARPGLLAHW